MNFFGHAVVAHWFSQEPAALFGAMLPDFESMTRDRVATIDHAGVTAGVALHHRTDEVFHAAPTFVAFQATGVPALQARGLGRGPARAIAHVGVEMLLDGWLVARDALPAAPYLAALRAAGPDGLAQHLSWRSDQSADRLEGIRRTLLRHGPPAAYDDPEVVGQRLAQILAPRPRLRVDAHHVPEAVEWLRHVQRRLREDAETLLEEVRTGLVARPAVTDETRLK